MTAPAPTEENPFPPPNSEEPPQPFDSQLTFDVTKKVNLVQLGDEISEALGRTVGVALVGDASFDSLQDPGPSNKATLAVSPGNVSRAKVQKALDAHSPIEDYDIPEAEREFQRVMAGVVENNEAELSAEDMQIAIKGLLVRASVPPITSGGRPVRDDSGLL
jgi:hypothetical protein